MDLNFSYRLTKRLVVPLSLSSQYNETEIQHNQWRAEVKNATLDKNPQALYACNNIRLTVDQVNTLQRMNLELLTFQNDRQNFYYYPLKTSVGTCRQYTCAYCLTDVIHLKQHAAECVSFYMNHTQGLDCFICRHAGTTEEYAAHFFDQNHTTKLFTAFIFDEEASAYAKVDYRHEQLCSKLHMHFLPTLDITLRHNLFAPIAMAIIVTQHSTKDLCHTASYLQQLDAELRLRPVLNGKYLTPCLNTTESFCKEMPLSPHLMFLILPSDCITIEDCGLGTHRIADRDCLSTKFKISAFSEEYLINGFFVLLYLKLKNDSSPVITYYRTKADPEDHYKYSEEQQIKAYSLYRARVEDKLVGQQQAIDYNDLMNLSICPDMVVTPYNFYFSTFFSRSEFAESYSDFINRDQLFVFDVSDIDSYTRDISLPSGLPLRVVATLQNNNNNTDDAKPPKRSSKSRNAAKKNKEQKKKIAAKEKIFSSIDETSDAPVQQMQNIECFDTCEKISLQREFTKENVLQTINKKQDTEDLSDYLQQQQLIHLLEQPFEITDNTLPKHRKLLSEILINLALKENYPVMAERTTFSDDQNFKEDRRYKCGDVFSMASQPLPIFS